jgi:hypothetical protein
MLIEVGDLVAGDAVAQTPRVNMTSRPRSTFPGMPVRDMAMSPYSLVDDVIGSDDVGVQCVAAIARPAANIIWRFTVDSSLRRFSRLESSLLTHTQ